MIKSVAIVFALALLGDVIVLGFGLPVPGPAIGLVMLAAGFAMRGGVDDGTARLFDKVSPHFPMFFIPAAVGIMAHTKLVASAWVYIALAVTFGTAATIVMTGWIAQRLIKTFKKTGLSCLN